MLDEMMTSQVVGVTLLVEMKHARLWWCAVTVTSLVRLTWNSEILRPCHCGPQLPPPPQHLLCPFLQREQISDKSAVFHNLTHAQQ